MKHAIPIALAAAAVFGVLPLTSAYAESDVNNDGLIKQMATVDGAVKMEQDLGLSSLQAINLVGARDSVNNTGEIIQEFEADSLDMKQRRSAGSIQAINAVTAGNPMTQKP